MPSSGCQTCALDRKSTRLNSSHTIISYAVFCLKKNLDIRGKGAPGLMYTPGTLGAPSCQDNPQAPSGDNTNGGTIILFFFKVPPPPKEHFFPHRPFFHN